MLIRYATDKKGKPVKKAVIYTRDEHRILRSRIDSDAFFVVSRLRDAGFDAYIVGGAVRDLLIGKEPKDFDIVTDATPSKIKRLFRNSRIIGKRFRLVHVFFGEKIFEVSTFRSITEGSVGNVFGTMDEDVQRRDFSMNALYYDPLREQVIDYVHGVDDIRRRVLRPVISLDRIFEEDPVRMLRAVKYSATTGCRLPAALKRRIRKSAHLLSPVSPSRLTEEMLKIVNSGHAYDIVMAALSCDLYMYLQPTACAMLYADKSFERRYMEHLRELDALVAERNDARLGEKLTFIIYDFIMGLTDWEQEVATKSASGELYTRTWRECRNFVLPINPPRMELEYAIRDSLRKLGVAIRMPKNAFGAAESGRSRRTSARSRFPHV